MDEQELKNTLLSLGMDNVDATLLIKIAKNKKTSVSRVFIMSLLGLYMGTATLIAIYFLFTYKMEKNEVLIFSVSYIPVVLIIYFFTPSLKKLFWSLKVLV
ncbi:hypothetical protein, partial [Yersinia entomophaga]